MKTKEKLELAKWAVQEAIKAGANEAGVDVDGSRDVEVSFREGKVDQLKESTVNSLSLTLYVDQRYSSHSTSDVRKETLTRFVTEAVAMTKYLGQDPFRTLPDPKYYKGVQSIDLNLYDPAYESYGADKMIEAAREMEEIAKAESDLVISCTAQVSSNYSESAKVHSNGFEGTRASTMFSNSAEATVRDGETGRPEDYSYGASRFVNQLTPNAQVGKECVQRAVRKVGQNKMESGVFEMAVENRAISRLLGAMRGPMSGTALHRKTSFLEGKIGQKIASEKLTITDSPFIAGGMGSRLYDGEGMATKERMVIDKGVLQMFYIDWYYSRKLGVEPTIGGSTNTLYELGDKSFEQLIGQITKGFAVTDFIGGNSNDTTGDFSYGIVGLYVENGKIIKPINEMNISGNCADFWNKIVEVGNDPFLMASNQRPSMLFRDVQFSGI